MQVVSRIVGTAAEQVVATGSVDLADLVLGLTREVMLTLSPGGGLLDLRVKALDFGLAAPAQGLQDATTLV